MQKQIVQLWVAVAAAAVTAGWVAAAEPWPAGLSRCREKASSPFLLVEDGRAVADIVLLTDGELLDNAGQWLRDFVQREAGVALPLVALPFDVADRLSTETNHLVAAVGDGDPLIGRLVAEGKLRLEPLVGEQGFVVQRASDAEMGELLVCWSPTKLGCRYALIEVLRSLRVAGRSVRTDLARVVDRPRFPMRICYLNFAKHLENAFNPNVLFDVPINRWQRKDWERLIDMISAFRYNVFEFWLVPSLFSPEALQDGKIQADFAGMMNHTIAYARRRGVSVYPISGNCVGRQWHHLCPNTPKEHDQILALWDHWSRTLKGYDFIGFFPGDPGGCIRNGCTPETFVDLCLELSGVVRKNNPTATVEIGTWGSPFAGWGVPLWKGKPDHAEYWNRVYGIYDHIPNSEDPRAQRAQRATQTLFRRFHYELALPDGPPTPEKAQRDTGKPEIRFTDPGVAVAGAALAAERIPSEAGDATTGRPNVILLMADLHDGGIRVPFIAYWPNHIRAGIEINDLGHTNDILPTVCSATGLPAPDRIDGISLLPRLVRGEPLAGRGPLFWQMNLMDWYPQPGEKPEPYATEVVRHGKWKLLARDGKATELFDLEADPRESANQIDSHRDVADGLEGKLRAWLQEPRETL